VYRNQEGSGIRRNEQTGCPSCINHFGDGENPLIGRGLSAPHDNIGLEQHKIFSSIQVGIFQVEKGEFARRMRNALPTIQFGTGKR